MDQASIPSVAKAFSDCAHILSVLETEEQRQTVLQLLRTLVDTMPQRSVTSINSTTGMGGAGAIALGSDQVIDEEKIDVAIRHSSIEGSVWERFLFAAV